MGVGNQNNKVNLRRGLVVFQFFIAQVLIFGTLTIGRQIDYMLSTDLGFDKDAIIYFYSSWRDKTDRREVLEAELSRLPEVIAVSRHAAPPASRNWSTKHYKI